MTLKHMRIYLAVYKYSNITKAAKELYMSQPAVSRAIQEIENHYGIRLFERISHRLYVTEIGKAFYSYALHIIDSFDQMERDLREWDNCGVLKIGTSIAIGSCLLPEVLAEFRKIKPCLTVKSSVSNGGALQKSLLDNSLDFAIMEGGTINEMLNAEVISKDRLVPVLPPDSPHRDSMLKLRELTREPLLLREIGSAGRSFTDHIFAVHNINAEPAMESVSTQALLKSVHAGLGISFLPEHLAGPEIDSGFVSTCTVLDADFTRENYLVWHKQKFLTNSALELMDCFRKHAKLT